MPNAIINIIFLAFVLPTLSLCQNVTGPLLCQGVYFSEAEGAARLLKVKSYIRSTKDWEQHADSMRATIRRGLELEKWPEKTPLNPLSRNKKTLDGYSVEAVVFESIPGFYVTGNLYRPLGDHGPRSLAVIACPHGHWDRPEDYGRFRNDMQYRCASFARMGAVVFSYDMIGYGESQQLEHRYKKGLTIQTWNTIRIIDYLLSFQEADPQRVAVTGASGGGTQTFLAVALDQRIKVSVPVVMASAHFFGGCTCESGLPIHRWGDKIFSNAEIACLAAPRPLLLVSDGNDWTKHNPDVEFPFAKHIYDLYHEPSKVANAHFANEKHDYGINKRLAVYDFLGRHLGLRVDAIKDNSGKVSESFVTIVSRKDLQYFQEGETTGFIRGDQVYQVLKSAVR